MPLLGAGSVAAGTQSQMQPRSTTPRSLTGDGGGEVFRDAQGEVIRRSRAERWSRVLTGVGC